MQVTNADTQHVVVVVVVFVCRVHLLLSHSTAASSASCSA
jgi:hypothetical protein